MIHLRFKNVSFRQHQYFSNFPRFSTITRNLTQFHKQKTHQVLSLRFKMTSTSMTSNDSILRYDDIRKPKVDDRLYRGLNLPNGLKALLISDPTTDSSAASLAVRVGAMNDFKELPGLAHFVEHMLFMGTKKYPDENAYQKFVSEHAGYTNAFTAEHLTNFYFQIGPDHLEPALDRFAQFFLEPLMDASAIDREVMAVNSEHEKNIPVDLWRIRQLTKTLSKQSHPYNHFSTGNKETLDSIPKSQGINVREKLLEFHKMWYSANIMSLVVLGKESLDELETMVVSLFKNVENKNVKKSFFEEHPYGPEQIKQMLYVVPIKDLRSLKISFPVPDVMKHYRTSPDGFISHLIGHEGPGSLHCYFRDRGLCNSLSAGLQFIAPGFGFFAISVDLTEEAMDKIDEIITAVFQYINLIKTKGIQEWLFEENRQINETTFAFKDNEAPSSYVTVLATTLDDYPMSEALSANYFVDKWEPKLIEEFLTYLTPNNLQVIAISQSYKDIADQTERWYGTKYKVESIPEQKIEAWKNIEVCDALSLPPVNKFIATDFSLYPLSENNSKDPYVVHESSFSRVWFKQDDKFLLPKLTVQVEIFSPIANIDPANMNLLEMFVSLVKDSLNRDLYPATLAGLNYNVTASSQGIYVGVSGFNSKLQNLLEEVLNTLTNFKVDEKRFEILKEIYVRQLKNFETEQPHSHAGFYITHLMRERHWSKADLLKSSEILEVCRLVNFIQDFFSRVYIQGLIHGNCNKQKVQEYIDIFEKPFKSTVGVLAQQLLPLREFKINNGCHYVYEKTNKYHSSSCYYSYFQCFQESTYNNVVLELFGQIVQEPCFNILRTQEQLGYIVMSGLRRVSGIQGFIVLVQSERHPVYLDSRVEEFLKKVHTMLHDMTPEEFDLHRNALITRRLEKPKQLKRLSAKYWKEISARLYNFDRDNVEVAKLRELTKDDILCFYRDNIDLSSQMRRKMAVHIISETTNPEKPVEITESGSKIEDIATFKQLSCLLPLPRPYINIDPVGTRSKL